jgi:conjugative transfer region protein TrbK
MARDGELARCQVLGQAAGEDARCRAAWATARSRFFGGAAS